MLRKYLLLPCVLSAIWISEAFAQGCPMCKESMTQAGEHLSHGFFLSIISLFALPFALIGGIGTVVVRSWWSKAHPDEPFTIRQLRQAVRKH